MAQPPLFQRGLEQLKAGNYPEAQRLFEQAEQQAGTAAETGALAAEADGRLAAGELDAAARLYEQVLSRNPCHLSAYLGLTRVGLFYGQPGEARTHATAATKLVPGLPQAWTLLGLVHEAEGDKDRALALLRQGAQLGPDSFLCQYNLGRFLAAEERGEEALAPLERATRLQPADPDAHEALGFAYRQCGRHEEALASLERAKDADPENVDRYATLADALFELQEFPAARALLDRGLSTCGDHPALLEKGVACALMEDDPAGAAHYVERELAVAPGHEQGYLNLAGLYLLTGELQRSEAVARTLLQRNPRRWEAWLHLADLYEGMSDDARAEPAYREALSLAPGEWKVLANFGAFLVQSAPAAKHAEALPLLERAVEAAPAGEYRPLYNLALCRARLGAHREAAELADGLLDLVPDGHPLRADVERLRDNLSGQR